MVDVEQTIWDDPSAGAFALPLHRRAGNEYTRAIEQDFAKREDVDGKQESAPPELRFVSQPKGVKLDLGEDDDDLGRVVPYYAYNTVAGQDFTVYVIDSGANPSNPDYLEMPGTKRWLKIDEDYWQKHAVNIPSTETDEQNHGSCVVSKVAGKTYGVAKKVNVVIAKVGVRQTDTSLAGWYIYLLQKVREDILKEKLKGKAVVNLSGGLPLTDTSVIAAMRIAVESLLKDDVVVVTTSGNDKVRCFPLSDCKLYEGATATIESETEGKAPLIRMQLNNPSVSKYPALFAETLTDLIVVGAVYTDGTATEFSQGGPLVTVCAPAAVKAGTRIIGISCADSIGTGRDFKVGTSFAAPQVAGIAAYFMSTVPSLLVPGQVAQNVKNYIVSKAYSRNRGPLAIFNDFDFRTGTTCAVAARKRRIRRVAVSSLDACLQSEPPTASTITDGLQTLETTSSPEVTTGLGSVGWLPDVASMTTSSVLTDKSVLRSSSILGSEVTQSAQAVDSGTTSPEGSHGLLTSTPSPYNQAVTTEVILQTTSLPPRSRETVTSVVWVSPASSPSSVAGVSQPIETSIIRSCISRYTSTYEPECMENCWGGKCAVFTNPFGNSQPWWTCQDCPTS